MNYYHTKNERIVCELCHHYCTLKEGQVGMCGVEKNENGELVNLSYGYPAALNVDPIEKKPLYHFLPGSKSFSLGTVGCNLRCPFCQNWQISQTHTNIGDEYMSPESIVEAALAYECASISYTYNEPVVFYPYARDIGLIAHEKGLKNIFVSSGYESPEVLEDMKLWVDGANIDLKSYDPNYYKKVLKAGLEEVKQSIVTMIQNGIWVEITTLLIEGVNDSNEELSGMAEFIATECGKDVPWHITAFHPDHKMLDTQATSLAALHRARKIALDAGLHYVYIGNTREDIPTCCPHCQERLIERDGFFVLNNRVKDGICPHCHHIIAGVWS